MTKEDEEASKTLWMELAKERRPLDTACMEDKVEQ
jgi:hypothetical protein